MDFRRVPRDLRDYLLRDMLRCMVHLMLAFACSTGIDPPNAARRRTWRPQRQAPPGDDGSDEEEGGESEDFYPDCDDPILPDGQAVNPLSPTTRAFLASRIERSGCSPSRARRMQQQMGIADGGDDGDGNGGGGGAEVVNPLKEPVEDIAQEGAASASAGDLPPPVPWPGVETAFGNVRGRDSSDDDDESESWHPSPLPSPSPSPQRKTSRSRSPRNDG